MSRVAEVSPLVPRPRGPFTNTQSMDGTVQCGRCEQSLPPDWDVTRPLPWLCPWCEEQLVHIEAEGFDEPREGE